ncbi:hypothetical protein EIP91_003763 [Steccherinum ochraceum]|uniref:Uncharacterized protein n=1 Tax=Steccherinum ochraceum TaxID=92696 RepID=A0A4R0RIF0_9APHY|nr:hypothetical protein EIP91_003763 [Steccherinum ochraceum]
MSDVVDERAEVMIVPEEKVRAEVAGSAGDHQHEAASEVEESVTDEFDLDLGGADPDDPDFNPFASRGKAPAAGTKGGQKQPHSTSAHVEATSAKNVKR